MTAELADGRKLEFPDNTDPAVIQATVKKLVKPEPSTARVALQSAAKGAAAVPDMFLGLPAQAFNLGSAGIGYAAGELGRPDITAQMPIAGPALTQPVRSGLEAVGAISPEFEPQTAGQRVLGRALEAAPSFAMSPTSGLKELGGKLAVGALSGGAGQATEELTGSKLAGTAVSMLAPAAIGKMVTGGAQMNVTPVKSETLKEARAAGYVVPPASVKPTAGARMAETVAGRAATAQDAALRNQEVTNTLAKKALGLPKDAVLTEESLEGVRKAASVPYQEVAKLSPVAASALERLKEARFETNRWFKFGQRTGDPTAQDKARAFQSKTEALEKVIVKEAANAGQVKQFAGTSGTLYHGTKSKFESFDVTKAGQSDPGLVGRAVYFTPTKQQAEQFARDPFYGGGKPGQARVISANVSLNNPFIIQDGKLPDGRFLTQVYPNGINKQTADALNKELIKQGYDGAIFKLGNDVTQVAVFDTSKISKVANYGKQLMEQLKEARKMIAKSYDVERALNVGDGNISARAIGRMLDQGKPLTGELKVIGRFAQAFPAVSREAAGVQSPTASGTDAASAALLATLGYGGGGVPGTMAGGLPLLRTPARNIALSQPMQNRLIREPQPLGTKGLEALLGGRAMMEPQ